MTFTYKLAKRIARTRGAIPAAVALGVACAPDRVTAPVGPAPGLSPVASVAVTPATDSGLVGRTVRLEAVALDSLGNVLTERTITWSSEDPSIATVDDSGLVTVLDMGAVRVWAKCERQVGTATLFAIPPGGMRPGHYVAVRGNRKGDGHLFRPWDLATALSGGGGRVRPGDTIWVRRGTYSGAFTSTVAGTGGAPVVIRAYPGERVVLDGAGRSQETLVIEAPYTVVWGLEVTNSDPVRSTTYTGHDFRPNSVVNYASHTRYVNLVVHDGGIAFYTDRGAADVEVYGSIFYNNGWTRTNNADGHALYLKSDAGPVVVRDNILFNQFGYGVHAYSNAGSGRLTGIRVTGNVAFNNGQLAPEFSSANILVGGYDLASGAVVDSNYTYYPPGAGGTNVVIGWRESVNADVTARDNRFVGGSPVLDVGWWDRVTLAGNVLAGDARVVALHDSTLLGYQWGPNQYRRDPLSASWGFLTLELPLAAWQLATGLGTGDVGQAARPAAPEAFVRPNLWEPGRATVIVYNWTGQGAVSVDLTAVLSPGDSFDVRNVQDLFGSPVTAGRYAGGAVDLPMGGVIPPVPVGLASSAAPRTGPFFDVFVVTRR